MTGQARNETAISPATVGTLKLLWKRSLSAAIASSPTVVDGRVYVGDWSGNEWAFDAATGRVEARAGLGTTRTGNCDPSVIGITSVPAFDRGHIYLAGGDDSFYCLDAVTLRAVWKTKLGDNSPAGGYYGWCSPAPFEEMVYQGVASNCDNPFVDGRVVALNESSGRIGATADLAGTSDPSHFGSGVWSSPAIDVDSRSVFVTTASAYHYDDGLAYSIVRIALDGLGVLDSWKITPAEYAATPDADWGSSPTLFHDSTGRLLVGAGQKNGQYYAFDRGDLAKGPLWKRRIAVGGDCPGCGEGTISTASFDGQRLYVGGGTITADSISYPASVSAIDPSTGDAIWTFFPASGPVLGPTSLANGVVFATAGASCVALEAASGRLLWQGRASAGIDGGAVISDGKVFFGDAAGVLFCYGVPASP